MTTQPQLSLFDPKAWLCERGILDTLALLEDSHWILLTEDRGESLWSCVGLNNGKWTYAGIPLGDDAFSECVFRGIAFDVLQCVVHGLDLISGWKTGYPQQEHIDHQNHVYGLLAEGNRNHQTKATAPWDMQAAMLYVHKHKPCRACFGPNKSAKGVECPDCHR